CILVSLFTSLLRSLPTSTLFPYTTLFRSHTHVHSERIVGIVGGKSSKTETIKRLHKGADFSPQVPMRQQDLREKVDRRLEFVMRSEEHTSELQSLRQLVCRLLLEKKHIDH